MIPAQDPDEGSVLSLLVILDPKSDPSKSGIVTPLPAVVVVVPQVGRLALLDRLLVAAA